MDHLEKQLFIRQKAAENRSDPEGAKVYWSRHAIAELINDNLTRTEVERALEQSEIIEEKEQRIAELESQLELVLDRIENIESKLNIESPQNSILNTPSIKQNQPNPSNGSTIHNAG